MPPSASKKRKASSERKATSERETRKKPKASSARETGTLQTTLRKRKSKTPTNPSRKKSKKDTDEDDDEDEDEDEDADADADADEDYEDDELDTTYDTPDHITLKELKEHKKIVEARLITSPNNESIKLELGKTKAAITILSNKIKVANPNSVMNKKIGKLKNDVIGRQNFLITIFGSIKATREPDALQPLLQPLIEATKAHNLALNNAIKAHNLALNNNKVADDKQWYNECKSAQTAVLSMLKPEYQQAYINLTTPLYLYLTDENYQQFDDLLKEFIAFIKSTDSKFTETRNFAKRHVVISDLAWVIFMNTGIWRQVFKDGHKLLQLLGIKGDINSIAKNNAKEKNIHSESSSTGAETVLQCPGCSRPILTKTTRTLKKGTTKTTIKKTDIGSAADHTNPVGHAFTEDKSGALVKNLVMICQKCNGAKLNTHFIKFFTWLQKDKTQPLYNYELKDKDGKQRTVVGLSTTIAPAFGDKRLVFYEDITHEMIVAGVLPLSEMYNRANEIKTTHDLFVSHLSSSLEEHVKDVLIAPTFMSMAQPGNDDTKLYEQLFTTLFTISIGEKQARLRRNEEVLSELFGEITQQQHILTRHNLQVFFSKYEGNMMFNGIPSIRAQSFEFFALGLANYTFNKIKAQQQSTSATSESISYEEFKHFFTSFIANETTKVKRYGDAGKIKNPYKKTRKSKVHKSFFNKTLKGKKVKR
jgi:hypothetical protein